MLYAFSKIKQNALSISKITLILLSNVLIQFLFKILSLLTHHILKESPMILQTQYTRLEVSLSNNSFMINLWIHSLWNNIILRHLKLFIKFHLILNTTTTRNSIWIIEMIWNKILNLPRTVEFWYLGRPSLIYLLVSMVSWPMHFLTRAISSNVFV